MLITPIIGAWFVGVQTPTIGTFAANVSGDTLTLDWSTNVADGIFYWVATTDQLEPGRGQLRTGRDASGNDAPASGSVTVTTTGAQVQIVTGSLPNGTYVFHGFQEISPQIRSDTVTSNVVVIDVQAASPTVTDGTDGSMTIEDGGTAPEAASASDNADGSMEIT